MPSKKMRNKLPALFLLGALSLPGAEKEDRPKAREILEGAVLTAPGTKPEVASVAMMRIGTDYAEFNNIKAIAFLKTSFDLSLGIPPGEGLNQQRVQSMIAGAMAPLSLKDSLEMLRRIHGTTDTYDPRLPAILKAVNFLLGKKQLDEAIELINSLGATGQYPFDAAKAVFEKLPKGDFRRNMVFGNAMTAYTARPALEFGEFLAEHWNEIPARTAEAALRSVVDTVMAMKDDGLTESLGGEKGALVLGNRQEVELFDLMHLLLKMDPKKAEEILAQKPNLRAAVAQFPAGRASVGKYTNRIRGYRNTASEAVASAAAAQAVEQIEKVIDIVGDKVTDAEVEKILSLAKGIPAVEARAELLASLAQATEADQPEIAKMVLKKSLELLADSKDPAAGLDALKEIARLAHGLHDDEAAWSAIWRMCDAALAIYKLDSGSETPNEGLMDHWPSTNALRRAVLAAADLFGAAADQIPLRVPDPGLALLVRLELAHKLLGRPHEEWITSERTPKKN